jgi:hypothetical protein
MEQKLKVGDKVKVMRQIGKDGVPEEVTGIIEQFNSVIRINGEQTATIKYDDNKTHYSHPLSQITIIND